MSQVVDLQFMAMECQRRNWQKERARLAIQQARTPKRAERAKAAYALRDIPVKMLSSREVF